MSSLRLFALVATIQAVTAAPLTAQPPSYVKQVKPFFARYCLECHAGDNAEGGLNLETYKGLLEGGGRGKAIVPGKPDESLLVRQVEGKAKPTMPPKKAKQPPAAEIALLRNWVAAGAKDDSAGLRLVLPDVRPKMAVAPPVTALAYRPDGKLLAAGSHKETLLIDVSTGDVVGKLTGLAGRVSALAFSRDGRFLTVSSGAAATAGEVRLYDVASNGLPANQPRQVISAHKDVVYDLTFRPDGKQVATCGYDRLIKLWDVETGKLVRELKDHSDAVYGVAFSPDGKLLASGSADRAVKIWDVASGKRLHTLAESTDWVYAVTWAPSGNQVAAAGVDKSIRVWEVTPTSARLVHSIFAHEGPVTRLAYGPTGQTLYSLSEDRTVKAWDAAKMVEQRIYAKQPDAPLALALRSDRGQLAIGRYDGGLVLLDEPTGKVQSEPLPLKPKLPVLNKLTPAAGQRGQTIHVKLEGKHLAGAEITLSAPGAKAEIKDVSTPDALGLAVAFPVTTPAGVYQVGVKTPAGSSKTLPFTVDPFPLVAELAAHNDSPLTGQKITLPASVIGSIGRAGDVDFYRFDAKAGQEIGVQVLTAAVGSKLEPVLQVTDDAGRTVAESTTGLLGYVCPKEGTYAIGIRDREYRGDSSMHYRLHVGPLPVVTAVFPLGLQRGTEAEVHVEGVNLGPNQVVRVKAPSDAALGSRVPVPVTSPHGTVLGNPSVIVGEFPETTATAGPALTASVTINGRIDESGSTTTYRFVAKKGQRLLLEVNARRLGSPLDSYLEILDAAGKPLPRATLRCVAKTYVTFRDYDSAGPGIRIESWNDLAMNDYVLVGNELIRINALPRGPDDDCQFFSKNGQRLSYLGTTPTHHPMGEPMYKVKFHPPGTTFPPNGLPVVTLFYRNDDGGPGFGKDSRLEFDPPADGEYQVRIGDALGQGSKQHGFRLTIRTPRPSFTVNFNPTAPAVSRGAALPINVNAERIDGLDAPIEVRLENLPPGFSAPPTTVPTGENSTRFALYAEPTATVPDKAAPLKLIARAIIDGKELVREVTGALPKIIEPGDVVTTTRESEVTVKPGGEVSVRVTVERRNGFKGRIPIEVRGLPHGVHVLDVGLNGILITEAETTRTFVIRAEPWVEPTEHPFVVFARREGKNTEHGARSVLLKVAK
jgi:WD40 repeat protein